MKIGDLDIIAHPTNGDGEATVSKNTQQVEKASRLVEIGSTGLKRSSGGMGLVSEEFLRELSGERGIRVYREMSDNDYVVGAVLYTIQSLIRQVEWHIEGDEQAAEFIDSCIKDMSTSWEDTLIDILSMLPYGWSWHEIVYKLRKGEHDDPRHNSKYSDGKLGWRKLPIRAQDTLYEWDFDEEGGTQAMLQMPPPNYDIRKIPIDNSLLFRTATHKGNPEGRSILRSAYRPWYLKKHIENIEAIGIERDLAGMPIIYRSELVASQYDTELKNILRNIKRNEQEGILLPLIFDPEGNEQLKFELIKAAGSRQIDTNAVINRLDRAIAMTSLADFIMLGQTVGSFALSSDKTRLFSLALHAILGSIASVYNQYGFPRLLRINGIKIKDPEKQPRLVFADIETPNLDELGRYITSLAGAGMRLFPDDDLENYLRTSASLPERPEEGFPTPPPEAGDEKLNQGTKPKPKLVAQPPKPEADNVELKQAARKSNSAKKDRFNRQSWDLAKVPSKKKPSKKTPTKKK